MRSCMAGNPAGEQVDDGTPYAAGLHRWPRKVLSVTQRRCGAVAEKSCGNRFGATGIMVGVRDRDGTGMRSHLQANFTHQSFYARAPDLSAMSRNSR